ncbi:hypothetical protein ACVR0S_05470 [Streptococcus dentapri]|uniref:Lipoprotein n=1 Tax=Streptococcus dentapri TaxID=573564 RepID=A0ABV8CZE2_9STRE
MIKQSKKFIILAVVIFLIFLALGKYRQTTALNRNDVLYATEVRDKQTKQKIRFEIKRTQKHKYRVENTKTKEVYETKPQEDKGNYIRIRLPENQGDIVIRQGLNPINQPTVTVQNSEQYEQIEGSSTVTSAPVRDDSSETSNQAEKTENQTSSLTQENEQKVIDDFGKWLYNSDYGKNAVVVQGQYDGIRMISNPDISFWSLKTKDNTEILTRLLGYYEGDFNDINGQRPIYVNNKQSNVEDLIDYKNDFDVTLLGNDLSSDKAEDFQSNAAFRLYTLKSPQHEYYSSIADEETELIDSKNIPIDEKNMTTNMGYNYYYKNYVDQKKDSYQIVLATDGKVYYVKDYWYQDYNDSHYVYQEAPEAMQKAYTDLIDKYASTDDNDEQSQTDSKNASDIFPSELIGTWSGSIGTQGDTKQTLTYKADGTVTKQIEGGQNSTAQITKMEKVEKGLYRFAEGTAIYEAIPTYGLGGVGSDMEIGVKINSDSSITYVYWIGDLNSEFDPSTYKMTELSKFNKVD